jgi:cytochrome c oxidase subunit I
MHMRQVSPITLAWLLVTSLLFPILIALGIFMRLEQAGQLNALQSWFYPTMTLHGLGMVGLWFAAPLACVSDALQRYVKPSAGVSWLALIGTALGVALLLVCVFLGRFAAGWYFLYPLPLMGGWPRWSAVLFLVALTVLGITWLVWSLDLLRAIARRYSLSHALAWHYLAGRSEPEVPPLVLIATVSLIVCVASLVAAVIVVALFCADAFGGVRSDMLLMKNLTFFFGHVIVNLSMYLGAAVTYEVLPEYTGRPWKTNRIVALSWNAVLVIVLLAYFHHLYMDFAQPRAVQYLGQIASYVSSIPAAVVTIFGGLALVYRSPMRWGLAPALFLAGLAGWAIGGVGAVIDSTITVNAVLHNTLWVPAHFHSYFLMGLVLLTLAYFHHACRPLLEQKEARPVRWLTLALTLVGGYGFLLMFYLAGAYSVPRRYAVYPPEVSYGAGYAGAAAVFAAVFLLGLLLYLFQTWKRWTSTRAERHLPREAAAIEAQVQSRASQAS